MFTHAREVLARELELSFSSTESAFVIRRLQGVIAGGVVRISGDVVLPRAPEADWTGEMLFSVDQVDVKQIVLFLNPRIADEFSGESVIGAAEDRDVTSALLEPQRHPMRSSMDFHFSRCAEVCKSTWRAAASFRT